jgi:hypothetical protein
MRSRRSAHAIGNVPAVALCLSVIGALGGCFGCSRASSEKSGPQPGIAASASNRLADEGSCTYPDPKILPGLWIDKRADDEPLDLNIKADGKFLATKKSSTRSLTGAWKIDGNAIEWRYDHRDKPDRNALVECSKDKMVMRESSGKLTTYERVVAEGADLTGPKPSTSLPVAAAVSESWKPFSEKLEGMWLVDTLVAKSGQTIDAEDVTKAKSCRLNFQLSGVPKERLAGTIKRVGGTCVCLNIETAEGSRYALGKSNPSSTFTVSEYGGREATLNLLATTVFNADGKEPPIPGTVRLEMDENGFKTTADFNAIDKCIFRKMK